MAALDFPLQRRASPDRRQLSHATGWLVNAGGRGRIRGVLLVKPAVPASRLIYLYCQRDHMLTQVKWSDPVTGAFEFLNLYEDALYMAVAVDCTGTYRAETHDGLATEPMP